MDSLQPETEETYESETMEECDAPRRAGITHRASSRHHATRANRLRHLDDHVFHGRSRRRLRRNRSHPRGLRRQTLRHLVRWRHRQCEWRLHAIRRDRLGVSPGMAPKMGSHRRIHVQRDGGRRLRRKAYQCVLHGGEDGNRKSQAANRPRSRAHPYRRHGMVVVCTDATGKRIHRL